MTGIHASRRHPTPRNPHLCECCRQHTRATMIRTYAAAVTWPGIFLALLVIAYENAQVLP